MRLFVALIAATAVVAVAYAALPTGCQDLHAVCLKPAACPIMATQPPATFGVLYVTTAGNFTIQVTTAWAVPYAIRLWHLSQLGYHVNAPFYRVDSPSFVVQFGYNGDPATDSCWDNVRTSNATWSVHPPGNVRGTVSFAMNAVNNTGVNPNCTSPEYCAQGFSTNIFVNYADNSQNLNAPGFSPFGTIDDAGMKVVDALYRGYGEVQELCTAGSTDPFCVGTGAACQGVSMDELVAEGAKYWRTQKPKLDSVLAVHVLA